MIYGFLKKIGLHSVIYGIGNISYALPGFILIPLYTRYLAPAEYGIFSLLTALFGILLYIYELGMVASVSRQFYEHDDNLRRKEVVSTAFFFIMLYCLALSAILYVFKKDISNFLFKTEGYGSLVGIGLAAIFFQALVFIPQTVIRLRERPLLYIVLDASRVTLLVCLTVLFLAFFKKGLAGIYEALLFTAVLSLAAYIASTIKEFAPRFSFFELKELLYLGMAYFPALLLSWIIESSDRYILDILTNLSAVGIYSLGYKIGQITMLLVKSFYLAWVPIIFSIVKLDNAPRIFGKIGTYFTMIISLFAVGLAVYSRELVKILATPEYLGAYKVVFLVSLSYVFYGLYIFFLTGITIKKKVYSLPIVLFVGAALNIILNFILIPIFGIMGAAAANLVSYASVAALTFYFSQEAYFIFYERGKIAKIILSGSAIYAASLFVRTENVYFTAGIKALFLCGWVFALYALGIISRQDVSKVKDVFTRVAGK